MTNHFTIKVSERLRELGISGETDMHWAYAENGYHPKSPDFGYIWRLANENFFDNNSESVRRGARSIIKESFPAYRLDDILRLMPRIGEKMGWPSETIAPFPESVGARSCGILFAFLAGDYPEAEQHLLTILKQ